MHKKTKVEKEKKELKEKKKDLKKDQKKEVKVKKKKVLRTLWVRRKKNKLDQTFEGETF